MPTRAEIRNWVRTQTLLETDDVTNAEVDAIIAQGTRSISTSFRWPYLADTTTISFVDSQQSYAFPSTVATIEKVLVTASERPLVEVTAASAWEDYGDAFKESSVPTHFFIWGRDINFIPIPSASTGSAKLFFYRKPTLMTNDTDEPEWSDEFHMILGEYAAMKLWQREEDYAKASDHEQAYNAMLNDMARYYLNPVEDYPTVFGGGNNTGRNRLPFPWLDAP